MASVNFVIQLYDTSRKVTKHYYNRNGEQQLGRCNRYYNTRYLYIIRWGLRMALLSYYVLLCGLYGLSLGLDSPEIGCCWMSVINQYLTCSSTDHWNSNNSKKALKECRLLPKTNCGKSNPCSDSLLMYCGTGYLNRVQGISLDSDVISEVTRLTNSEN